MKNNGWGYGALLLAISLFIICLIIAAILISESGIF